jgi:hypothetical protein
MFCYVNEERFILSEEGKHLEENRNITKTHPSTTHHCDTDIYRYDNFS